ncbi:MAG: hypothetical protein ACRERU_11325 [Methylococcales bacterium]
MVAIDQGEVDSAIRVLSDQEAAYPDNLDVLRGLAYSYETSGDLFKRLDLYDKILNMKPGDSDILRRQILAINKLGANARGRAKGI